MMDQTKSERLGMRLTCPNCGAEYDVDDRAIPDAGRDVQCASCGHGWFQLPDSVLSGPAPGQASPDKTGSNRPMRAPAPDPDEEQPRPAPRRPLDKTVEEVLRAEAEREARVRRGLPPEPLEDQPDLPLGPAADTSVAERERLARVRDADLVSADVIDAGLRGSRKDLLPDIEEINSTLRPRGERAATSRVAESDVVETVHRIRRGQGFRFGFGLVLLAAAGGLIAYSFGADLSERFPQAAPFLDSYADWVNATRVRLDDGARLLIDLIDQTMRAD